MIPRFSRPVLKAAAITLAAGIWGSYAFAQPDGYRLEANVLYREVEDVKLRLDLYHPSEQEEPHPALLLLHGGGWKAGNRAMMGALGQSAAARGYLAAVVSYRLTNETGADGKPKYVFPDPVHDVKAAVRWLRENATRLRIDPDRIGVAGESAGGHLALMVGLVGPEDGLEPDTSSANVVPLVKADAKPVSTRVAVVVNMFGPTELVSGFETSEGGKDWIREFIGGRPEEMPERYLAASPLTYVSADDPPILTLHGRGDRLVPVQQALQLERACRNAEVSHQLIVVETAGHGFKGRDLRRVRKEMFLFLDSHLRPTTGPKPHPEWN